MAQAEATTTISSNCERLIVTPIRDRTSELYDNEQCNNSSVLSTRTNKCRTNHNCFATVSNNKKKTTTTTEDNMRPYTPSHNCCSCHASPPQHWLHHHCPSSSSSCLHHHQHHIRNMNCRHHTLLSTVMVLTSIATALALLASKLNIVESAKLADIHWNASNPIFRIDNTDHIIDVNKNAHQFDYDQVDIVCPQAGAIGNQSRSSSASSPDGNDTNAADRLIIYNVSKDEYDMCTINSNARTIAVCDSSAAANSVSSSATAAAAATGATSQTGVGASAKQQRNYFTVTFRSFSPQPNGLEFRPGQDYYFISAYANGPPERRFAPCQQHNMKVIFKVCCKASTATTPGHSAPGAVASGGENGVQQASSVSTASNSVLPVRDVKSTDATSLPAVSKPSQAVTATVVVNANSMAPARVSASHSHLHPHPHPQSQSQPQQSTLHRIGANVNEQPWLDSESNGLAALPTSRASKVVTLRPIYQAPSVKQPISQFDAQSSSQAVQQQQLTQNTPHHHNHNHNYSASRASNPTRRSHASSSSSSSHPHQSASSYNYNNNYNYNQNNQQLQQNDVISQAGTVLPLEVLQSSTETPTVSQQQSSSALYRAPYQGYGSSSSTPLPSPLTATRARPPPSIGASANVNTANVGRWSPTPLPMHLLPGAGNTNINTWSLSSRSPPAAASDQQQLPSHSFQVQQTNALPAGHQHSVHPVAINNNPYSQYNSGANQLNSGAYPNGWQPPPAPLPKYGPGAGASPSAMRGQIVQPSQNQQHSRLTPWLITADPRQRPFDANNNNNGFYSNMQAPASSACTPTTMTTAMRMASIILWTVITFIMSSCSWSLHSMTR